MTSKRMNVTRNEILTLFNLVETSEKIEPGDLYIGQRNTTNLLTCLRVDNGMVIPTTLDYPFDIHECVKVVEK